MKKGRLIVGLILNVLAVAAAAFGVLNAWLGFAFATPAGDILTLVQDFTIDANILFAVVGLIAIIAEIVALGSKKASKFVGVLRVMATTALTVAMAGGLAYFAPFVNGWPWILNLGSNLWIYIVAPALAILALIIDNQPRLSMAFSILAALPAVAYLGVMIPLILNGVLADPYGFLTLNPIDWVKIVVIAGIIVGSILIALILICLHNIGSRIKEPAAKPEEPKEETPAEEPAKEAVEEPAPVEPMEEPAATESKPEPAPVEEPKPEEPKPEPKPQPQSKLQAKPEPKPAAPTPVSKPVATGPANGYKGKARAYHITKQPSGKWQVKLANGAKAIRLFDTQAEAIAFTKGLVESQGGSYRIHSVKGKIRK